VSDFDVGIVSVMVDGKPLDGVVRSIEYRPHDEPTLHGDSQTFEASGEFTIERGQFRLLWRALNRPIRKARRRARMARKRRRGWP
jgi:hypothetical protein